MDRDDLKPLGMSLRPLIESSNGSAPSTNIRQAKAEYSIERARLLFGQFRKGDANDPETYSASIAAVLAEYPDEVIRQATDPRTGLGSRLNWLPTVKEVREFCQEVVDAEARAAQRERDFHWQIAGRAEYEKARKSAPQREALKAKGFLKEKPVNPLPADALHQKLEDARQVYGPNVVLSEESKIILIKAGYHA